jgi:hypothetical protein
MPSTKQVTTGDLTGADAIAEAMRRRSNPVPSTDLVGDPAGFAEVSARKAALLYPPSAPVVASK